VCRLNASNEQKKESRAWVTGKEKKKEKKEKKERGKENRKNELSIF
jgi:hypothetical protein